jgi:pimeloyl-ACP methyl ester carboxylesterase
MSIYRNPQAKAKIMALYDQKLSDCALSRYESHYVQTSAGTTHVIVVGDTGLPPVVVLHGINAGVPVSLEAMQDLYPKYCVYAIDSIGQTTRSAETRLPVKDNSYGYWLSEVMEGLGLEAAPVVGISYGGFLLQKLIMVHPEKVEKAIFIVPAGVVNSDFFTSMQKLFLPMTRFFITKKDKDLKKFISSFYTQVDDYALAFQRETLLGLKMDYSRPPLLTREAVAGYEAPVYAMVADDDVFFPGEACVEKLREAFGNFKEAHVLKNCRHIPSHHEFTEIAQKLDAWLQEKDVLHTVV